MLLDYKALARLKLSQIFSDNGWSLQNYPTDLFKNAYNQMCKMFEVLTEEEVNLILTLTTSYKCYDYQKYFQLLVQALKKIEVDFLNSFENIFITQLITPEDIAKGNIKSSSQLLYTANELLWQLSGKTIKAKSFDNIDTISTNFKSRGKSLIIMLDDYIGSSGTSIKAISYYFEKHAQGDDYPIVLSLVAQQEGINCLTELGIDVRSGEILSKGIEDNPDILDKTNAYNAMNSIENHLKIEDEYYRGYYCSEALITMVRTPNNTFPLYWRTKGRFGKVWPAPFERS